MPDMVSMLANIQPANATLIGASLATCGWLYTAGRARTLARKQHTLNVMVQARFNSEFKTAEKAVAPNERNGVIDVSDPNCPNRENFKTVLNYYEFLASGIRNGDFDEQMVKDSLRGTILNLYEGCQEGIFKLRTNRRRVALYEHLEWLHRRWERKPPSWPQKAFEKIISRPIGGKRKKHDD